MRTIIDLPQDQIVALTELCKTQKISRAEAVRRAITSMLSSQHEAGREKAFGAWQKKMNGGKFVRDLRQEWEE